MRLDPMLMKRNATATRRLPSPRHRAGQCATVSAILAATLLLASCGGGGSSSFSPETQFFGVIAADEPNAVNAARQTLVRGGSAADAAVSLGLGLAVTLPSRAGLGGGGVCLMHAPQRSTVEALEFMPRRVETGTRGAAVSGAPGIPVPGQLVGQGGSVVAAMPGLARGLAAVQARFGKLRWGETVAPAESLARFRARVSRSLAQDIAAYAAASGFDGQDLVEGDEFTQTPLADTLATLRVKGAGELYTGALAAAVAAGTGLPIEALRRYTPDLQVPLRTGIGDDLLYFPPTAGGQAMLAVATRLLTMRDLPKLSGAERAQALLDAERTFLPPEVTAKAADGRTLTGASTGFLIVDRDGGAVACALTMGRPFGTGRIIGDTGILAALPDSSGGELALGMAPALAINASTQQFSAAYVGSGSPAAAGDTALTAVLTEPGTRPLPETIGAARAFGTPGGPGAAETPLSLPGFTTRGADDRVHGAVCTGGLPRRPSSCDGRADPRGAGAGGIIDNPL